MRALNGNRKKKFFDFISNGIKTGYICIQIKLMRLKFFKHSDEKFYYRINPGSEVNRDPPDKTQFVLSTSSL
jgi:hypothetical protein